MLFAYDTVRNTTHSLVRRLPVEPMGIKVVSGDTQQTSSGKIIYGGHFVSLLFQHACCSA